MHGHYLYNYLYKLLGILLQGILSVLPHLFICLVIDLYQYGLMEIYLIFWVIIQYYSILFLKLVQLWLLSQLSVYASVPFIIPYIFFKIFISWRLITSQHCSGFCQTLTWISHGVTCIPHPDPPSHLPLHPIPLGLPGAHF